MNADTESVLPLYFQIERDLASSIASVALAPGSQLPTEEELIRGYGVSRTTVRKAIQELERLELIEIRRGRGTFVRATKVAQEFSELTGFVEDMIALGLQPSARVLGTAPTAADETVARQLRVPIGTEVMQIRRVRIADGVALSLDETYLPIDLGRKVVENDLEAPTPSSPSWRRSTTRPSWRPTTGSRRVAADRVVAEALRGGVRGALHPPDRAGLLSRSTWAPGGL